MKNRVVIVLSLAAVALVTGCSSQAKREREELIHRFEQLKAQAATVVVDASDGISEVEAYKVACDYFDTKPIGCGAVGLPREEEVVWRVPIFYGIAGLHTEDVIVRKSDGSHFVERTRGITSNNPQK